jgi:arylsulfatase A-like enzyme
VQRIDTTLAQLIASAEQSFGTGNFTVIVTADHGGHDKNHGSSDPLDVTIPWIAWGRGVTPAALSRPVETIDTAATVLWLFGVERPNAWAGKSVAEAFAKTNLD